MRDLGVHLLALPIERKARGLKTCSILSEKNWITAYFYRYLKQTEEKAFITITFGISFVWVVSKGTVRDTVASRGVSEEEVSRHAAGTLSIVRSSTSLACHRTLFVHKVSKYC